MFEDEANTKNDGGISRREFVGMAVAATVTASAEKLAWAIDTKSGMTYRTLGRTGEKVSMMGLGGFHIGVQKDEQESIRIIRTAIDNGVNFLDNCWDYNGGESEVRMGKALRDGYRQRAFLMTKIDGRTRKAATEQLDESLRRLQTDHIDLLQFHEIIRMGDPEKVFAPGAGMEAIVEARKAGKVRYIGFTGHKSPGIHLKMLETADAHGFHFDSVQTPLNVMDAHFNSFGKKVLPVLVEERNRRAGNEADWQRVDSAEQCGEVGRVFALCDEFANQRGDHRVRFDGDSKLVDSGGAKFSCDE
jgi:uncharacterized protein